MGVIKIIGKILFYSLIAIVGYIIISAIVYYDYFIANFAKLTINTLIGMIVYMSVMVIVSEKKKK